MKSLIVIAIVLLGAQSHGEPLPLNLSPFTPEVQAIIRQQTIAYEQEEAQTNQRRMVIITAPQERKPQRLTVFGFTEEDVLRADGDPHGEACSSKHNQGDMSNRWCHAYFVKLADSYLREKGVNKEISAILSVSILVPKEFLIDLHPSASDLVMTEYEFYNQTHHRKNTRATITVFGDKAIFMTLQKQF